MVAALYIIGFSVAFVASIYIFPTSTANSSKETYYRTAKVLAVSIIAQMFIHTTIWHFDIIGIAKVIILNTALFTGEYISIIRKKIPVRSLEINSFTFKMLLFAPFAEEFLYRGCFVTYLIESGYSTRQRILLAPLVFGLSHFHFLIFGEKTMQLIVAVCFQGAFTYVFGIYSGYIFIQTHSIWPSIILHSYCNLLGFPQLSLCFNGIKREKIISTIGYTFGLLMFCALIKIGFM
jgi:membrane protease YdiL (CAAX protease family)